MARALRGLVLAFLVGAGIAALVYWLRSRRGPAVETWDYAEPAQPPSAAPSQAAPLAPAADEATPAEYTEILEAPAEAAPAPAAAIVPVETGAPLQAPIILEYGVPDTVVLQLSESPAAVPGAGQASAVAAGELPEARPVEPGPIVIDFGVVETQVIVLNEPGPLDQAQASAAPAPVEQPTTIVQYPTPEPRIFMVDNSTPPAPVAVPQDAENALVDAFERLAREEPGLSPQLSPASAQEPAPAVVATAEPEAPASARAEPAPVARATQEAAARTADSHLDEGNVYFNVGQYILAIECYSRAIDIQPDLVAAYYNRANARTRLGHYGQALSDYDTALELDATDADALNNRGMLHLYRADYPAALHDFDRALGIDPSDTTIMVNRGLAHLHGGDASSALTDFVAATKADPGDAAAHYGCAQATATLGERETALGHLKTALSIDRAYAREAAADPKFASLQGDEAFLRLLRDSGGQPA